MGKYEEALKLFEKTLEIAKEVLEGEHPTTNKIYNNMLLTKKVMEKQENE